MYNILIQKSFYFKFFPQDILIPKFRTLFPKTIKLLYSHTISQIWINEPNKRSFLHVYPFASGQPLSELRTIIIKHIST